MKKLTKVGIACVLGLMLYLLPGTSGAFAQSVNQGGPAAANWGRQHHQASFWRNPWGGNGCGGVFCNQDFGGVRCTRAVKLVKIWYTRRVVETFRTLRISRMMVNIYTGWGIRRAMKEVKAWQVRRVARTIRTLRLSRQTIHTCHAW